MREIQRKGFFSAISREIPLTKRLCRREISGRYRGSTLGWLWSILNPLLMLGVYTFVFSKVFNAKWGTGIDGDNEILFALNLFAGLIVFNMFGECAIRAPSLVVNQANYVKKVIFPLEILATVATGAALFHAVTSLGVLLLVQILSGAGVRLSIILVPIVWTPLILGCMAMTWTLAAIGTYIRDLAQVSGLAVNILMFMSAVFYPLDALPERWQPILGANPLVHIIEQTRRVCIEGQTPSASYLVAGISGGWLICELSFRLFQKARGGFADVL